MEEKNAMDLLDEYQDDAPFEDTDDADGGLDGDTGNRDNDSDMSDGFENNNTDGAPEDGNTHSGGIEAKEGFDPTGL